MQKYFCISFVLAFMLAGVAPSGAGLLADIAPSHLTCEYLTNPLGIEEPAPRLSWQTGASQRGVEQIAYQITVSTNPNVPDLGETVVWNSGKVQSDQSILIPYAGKPLQSGVRYYWRVQTWLKDSDISIGSEPAFWQMGLLEKSDWKGKWIGFGGKLPAPARRHNGYHSQIANKPDQEKWVVIDLGETQTIDSVRLYPAHPFDFKDTPGFLYPVRFRIDAAADPAFQSFQTVYDNSGNDVSNPGDVFQTYSFKPVSARYVRLYVIKLANREEQNYGFALAEMQVLSGEKNLALGKIVTGLDSINNDSWSSDRLTDGVVKAVDPGQNWSPNPSPMLRKTFQLPSSIVRATLTASALGLYEFSINGERVGKNLLAPEWTDYNARIQYQTYDVTSQLRQGENALGAILGEGWYAGRVGLMGRFRIYGEQLALYAQLDVTCADGSRLTIVSDGSWKGTLDGPVRGNDTIHGEIWDARKEIPDWNQPAFNDAQWSAASEIPAPSAKLVAQVNEPIQITQELTPIAVTQPKPYVYVYDLGQNLVGWCRVKASGAPGMSIRLQYGEVLKPDGTVYTENLRGPYQVDELILNATETCFEPRFTYHGFRYLQISGLNREIPLQNIVGCVVHSAPPFTSSFECSSPMLNKLFQNILWTQRGNMHSIPTDCPQRDERLGWMGDAQIFSQAACFNMNMGAFYTKWLQDIRDAQSDAGQFSDFSPNPLKTVGQFLGAPSWADAGIIVPWRAYVNYGDKRILERHYSAMQRWIDYAQKNSTNYIWTNGRGNDYGDWLNGDTLILENWPKKGADISREQLATAFAAHSAELLSRMAKVLNNNDDAVRYAKLHLNIRKAYCEKYFDKEGKNVEDNQTAYALALHFRLIPKEWRKTAVENILRKIADYNGHISTGIQATNRMMMELADEGYVEEAYALLNNRTIPSWGYMVDRDATTVWERWDGWVDGRGFQNPGMNSFNHYAIGAVGEWMMRNIGGINPDAEAPGYKCVRIEPRPGGGLTFAKASYDSIYGKISVAWKKEPGVFTLDVTIPANASAVVVLPATPAERAMESGIDVRNAPPIQILGTTATGVRLSVPSGTYKFRVSDVNKSVSISPNRFLSAEGKPFFPIGAYAFPKRMSFEEGKAMGFNLVHISDNPGDWDAAQKAGLRVWRSFGDTLDFSSGDVELKKANIEKIVNQFASHPALLFWESMDEPAWTDGAPSQARATAQGLASGRKFLRDLDSSHPVYLNHAPRNTVDTLRAYNPACEIVCADIYPIIPAGMKPMYAITPDGRHGDLPNQTPSCVGEYVEKMKSVADNDRATFVVLQGFAWEALRGEQIDPAFVRYPSYRESRFMAYNAITHGVNGLMFWGLAYVPKDHPFIGDLARVLNEINELTPAILGSNLSGKPALRYYERGSTISSGVEILGRQTADRVYLIASNTSVDPAAVDFIALPIEFSKANSLTVLGENRSIPITDGKFFDEFEGLSVHVYVLEKRK